MASLAGAAEPAPQTTNAVQKISDRYEIVRCIPIAS
jgi:hypothetical protein